MKRILILVIILLATFGLYACGEDIDDDVTIPSFDYFLINEETPTEDTIYAEKNALLRLDIFIDNPSNLEINSIRINGTTYRQSRFDAESTNEHIIFHFDVLRVPGHNDYALEAVEYTHDGVQTLLINNNNTWNAYVLESTPTGQLESITTHQDSLSVSVNLSDSDGTIDDATLELVKENEVIDSKPITSGIATHTFDELHSDSEYTLRINASYNRGDGHDVVEGATLAEESNITTVSKATPQVSILDIEADKTSVSFSYDVNDEDSVGSIASILLYHDGEEIASLENFETLSFSDLMSDTPYSIVIEYTYDLDDQSGSQTLTASQSFTTIALETPEVTLDNLTPDHQSVIFDISLEDYDEVLDTDHLTIVISDNSGYEETKTIDIDQLTAIQFDNLLSNTMYTIEVKGNYDLNDAQGLRENVMLHSETFITEQTEMPTMESSTVSTSETEMTIQLDASSFDEIRNGEAMKVYIYNNDSDELLKTFSMIDSVETVNIVGLLSNQSIRIEVETTYDLKDGEGEQTDIVHTNVFTTTQNSAPTGSISNIETSQEGISFTFSFTDASDAKVEGSLVAHLYEDDGTGFNLVDTKVIDPTTGQYTFDHAPHYDKAYSVEIYVDYDLRDGEGIHNNHRLDNAYKSLRLIEKAPQLSLDEVTVNGESATIEYTILDVDETIVEHGITLSINGQTYTKNTLDDHFTLSDLNSDTTYEYTVTVEYVSGGQTYTIEESGTLTTEAKTIASGTVNEISQSLGSITVEVSTQDIDNVFTADDKQLVLYDDEGNIVDTKTFSEVGEFTFDSLQNNRNFTLHFYGTIDKNDGEGSKEILLDALSFTTINGDIEVHFDTLDIDQEFLKFEVDYEDEYEIIDGSLTIIVYNQDGIEISTQRVQDGLTEVQLSGLYSNYTYNVRIYGDVDYLDGAGVQRDKLLFEESMTTEAKAQPIPSLTIESIEVGTSISVTLDDFEDVDDVYSSMTLYLYKIAEDGTAVLEDSIVLDLTTVEGTYTFDHIHDETGTYRIELRGDYDLNDSNVYTDELLIRRSVTTIRP